MGGIVQQIILTDTQVGYVRAMAKAGRNLEKYFLEGLPTELKRIAIEVWYRARRETTLEEVVAAQATNNVGAAPSNLEMPTTPLFRTRASRRGKSVIAAMIGDMM